MTKRPREEDIARYFDGTIECCAERRDAGKRPGVKLARALERRLRAAGIAGHEVLELGCGRGELATELVRAGASRVTGIDLAANNIAVARRSAEEDGLGDRLSFMVGNAADVDLPAADAVVHHRVLCCYPDAAAFLQRSIAVAGSIYGFSMPRSTGPIGVGVRIALVFENLGHRLRQRGFRAYVHDERMVDAVLRAAGFRLDGRTDRLGWFAAVYIRNGAPPQAAT